MNAQDFLAVGMMKAYAIQRNVEFQNKVDAAMQQLVDDINTAQWELAYGYLRESGWHSPRQFYVKALNWAIFKAVNTDL